MQFPKSESEISTLAQDLANGLEINTLEYPAPPYTFETINDAIATFSAARETVITAKATAEAATTAKQAALADLIDKVKKDLRYAENLTSYDDDKLKQLGWSGRKSGTSLNVPGQPPLLTISDSGPGDLSLEWRKPQDGGLPASYRIERRLNGDEIWSIAGLAVETEATLTLQPRGDTYEYRVAAVNKAGVSPASNIVAVVL